MTEITLTVNGRRTNAMVEPRTHLADFLREQQRLTGTHIGCEHGVCGACTVLLDGEPIRSCIAYAVACDGREVRTIEAFEQDELMAELREAFSREHGLQCGFCTAGMLITARDICLRYPHANEDEIRIELSGNLCRCTGYVGIVTAVKSVMKTRAGAAAPIAKRPTRTAAQTLVAFTPIAQVSEAHAIEAARLDSSANVFSRIDDRGIRISETIEISASAAAVWRALSDIPTAASCLPGAEIVDWNERSVKGRVQVKFGPMRASFDGAAAIERSDHEMTGSVRGAGVDSLSKTRARGELTYRVVPVKQEETARIEVDLAYVLVGPLAQFSRSGLVKDFANRLIVEFARNLKNRINQSKEPPRKAELHAGALLLSVLWHRLKRAIGFSR